MYGFVPCISAPLFSFMKTVTPFWKGSVGALEDVHIFVPVDVVMEVGVKHHALVGFLWVTLLEHDTSYEDDYCYHAFQVIKVHAK